MPYPIAHPAWLDRHTDALLPAARPLPGRASSRRAELATPTPPAPPAPASSPARTGHAPAPAAARPLRRLVEKAGREGPAPRELPESVAERPPTALPAAACGERERERGSGGEGDNEDTDIAAQAASDTDTRDDLDSALIAALLAQGPDSGVFEVLLPGGETLGVAVDVRPDAVDYLLTPASNRLGEQLRGRQMELAGQLRQRIGRSVRVTVL
ncbi:hypothetical protein [Pseudoduganella chitinolytica]|uniref:Flagellar hook-length control protein FliK n=1 Tax=Pseudoduganella chitinolytica TaxID=34070 RepID=A0ABY8BD02_9BURK|nr:hypothetical protein [Pseudoduganella chitinolytica]WEF32229.1 hypothetical protein PX653_22855 [Pseudoduganella chitinolytica]